MNWKLFSSRRTLLSLILGVSLVLNLCLATALAKDAGLRRLVSNRLENLFGDGEAPSASLPPGRWLKTRPAARTGGQTPEDTRLFEQLESVGYLSGSREAPERSNITVSVADRTSPGLNLYTAGHAPEAILIDMQGNVLHRWARDVRQVWPNRRPHPGSHNHEFWRRVHLLENGDLLAVFEGLGLVRLGKHSNVIWARQNKAHHDLEVTPEGKILVLTRAARIDPAYNRTKPILEDFISVLDEDGEELNRVSILKCIENSDYAPILENMPREGDILHTNTLELLDGRLEHRSSAFRQGNVLVSILKLDLVGIIDLESERMVWALTGLWRRQHQPSILDNGNMLIFDNQGLGTQSRIIELDPFSQEVHWAYSGTPDHPFYSYDCGSSEQLPNGNVLVTESNGGRAFELTPGKEIVWEFFVPHRAGSENEFIATLFEMTRIPRDYPSAWLEVDGD